VTIDTLRADALGAYGALPSPSPHLDALAVESALYQRAISPLPMTRPAHFSIFTSRYPREHGVLNNRLALPEDEITLAEVFQEHGYRTGGFVAAAHLSPASGAGQGFEVHKSPPKRRRKAYDVVGSTLTWLETLASSDPFFAWVHLFDPHQPYKQLDPQLGKVDAAMLSQHPKIEWSDLYQVAEENGGDIPRAVFDHALALYGAEVAYADNQVGRLLDGLRALRDLDDVIVVVTSDHGECFENGVFFEHSDCMQQGALLVPLLIRHPGTFEPGSRSDAVVSHIDIAPTVLEAAGIPAPASFSGVPLQHANSIRGERHVLVQYPFYQQEAVDRRLAERRVIETVAGMPLVPVVVDKEQVGLVGANWKYLRSGSREELYRLGGDAEDVRNWAPDEEIARKQLAGALDVMLERHPLVLLDSGEINDELRATLEALGYIQ
jgi:arylsulfatase A-like enzyme